MVKEGLNNIFLSASIPNPDRDKKYFETADIVAIRDSVRALATVVVPKAKLVWGGHPSITPLIKYVMEKMEFDCNSHMVLYQSEFFRDKFPDDNYAFENVKYMGKGIDRDESLSRMRTKMFTENEFSAGIFIGGMDGVIEEYRMFNEFHPKTQLLPIASTGGAAKIIYDEIYPHSNKRLVDDYAYMALFREHLKAYL